MHIAISGASGFVGRRLVQTLEAGNHTTARLGRDAAKYLPIKSPLDAVVHLAGEPVSQRWNDEVKQRIRDSRIVGTRSLVNAMGKLETKPRVLVCASAIDGAVTALALRGSKPAAVRFRPAMSFLTGCILNLP